LAVFQVDIQTHISADYVSNVWHVNAASEADAMDQGVKLAHYHAALIPPAQTVDYIRVNSVPNVSNTFISQTVSIPGTRTDAPLAPPFNRFRILFFKGQGRPLVKFLVWPYRTDFAGDGFIPATIAYVNTNFIVPLLDDPDVNLCSSSGVPVVSAVLSEKVGMRQLRRASKRTSPVL